MAKPKVIGVTNQKGGVGESTTVYNLWDRSCAGKKIMLLGIDIQSNLTKILGQRNAGLRLCSTGLPPLAGDVGHQNPACAGPRSFSHLCRLLGGGELGRTCRNGAAHQVQIKFKLKIGGTFSLMI